MVTIKSLGLSLTPYKALLLREELLNELAKLPPPPKEKPYIDPNFNQVKYNLELSTKIKSLWANLLRSNYPKAGICSHFGVSLYCEDDYINIVPRKEDEKDHTLVTIYRTKNQYRKDEFLRSIMCGYSQNDHLAKVEAVAQALNAKIVRTWNGSEGSNGISVVLDIQPPESLCSAVANYFKLPDVFNLSPKENQLFADFSDWLESSSS